MGRFPAWQKHSTSESSPLLWLPCTPPTSVMSLNYSFSPWALVPESWTKTNIRLTNKKTCTKSGTAGARLDLIVKNWTKFHSIFHLKTYETQWVFPLWLPRLGSGERISRSAFSVFSACKSVNNLGVLNVCLEAKNSWKKRKNEENEKTAKNKADFLLLFARARIRTGFWLLGHLGHLGSEQLECGGPTSECKALRKLLQPSTRTRPQRRSPETWTETGKKQQRCFSATSISMKLSLVTYDIRRKLKHLDSWTASEAPSGRTSALHRIWPWPIDPPDVGNSWLGDPGELPRRSHVQI